MFDRWVQASWRRKFAAPQVHIVFGARQTGKSTLIQALLPDDATRFDLSIPGTRSRGFVCDAVDRGGVGCE